MAETALDRAHAAMAAVPDEDAARLRFYQELADAELFLLLQAEPKGNDIAPQVFALEAGQFVMTFDREDRLAAFCDRPAPYAALPGRVIAGALAGQDVGLGLNLGVAASGFLMPPEALAWLTGALDHAPQQAKARPVRFKAPTGMPQSLIAALRAKLERMPGLARRGLLTAVTYGDGRHGHMLAFVGAAEASEAALAKALSEALIFSGIEAGELDVAFFAEGDPALARMAAVAIVLPLPETAPAAPPSAAPSAPGMDRARPPKLR